MVERVKSVAHISKYWECRLLKVSKKYKSMSFCKSKKCSEATQGAKVWKEP